MSNPAIKTPTNYERHCISLSPTNWAFLKAFAKTRQSSSAALIREAISYCIANVWLKD